MIQSDQLVAVVLVIAIFGAMLAINFLFDRREVGSKLARGRIVTAAVSIVAACLLVWFVLTLEVMGATIVIYFLGGAIALFGIVAVIKLIALQPKEDVILLDLNDANDDNLTFSVVALIFVFIYYGFFSNLRETSFPVLMLCMIPLIVFGLGRRVRSTYVTEAGLYTRDGRLEWQQIKECRWDKTPSGKDVLLIRIRGRIPFFDRLIVRVAPQYKEALSGYLQRFAPQAVR